MDLEKLAERSVENGECGAQIEIEDESLRQSLVRNFAVTLQQAVAEARKEWLKFACRAMCMVPQNITDDDGLHEPSCIALRRAALAKAGDGA